MRSRDWAPLSLAVGLGLLSIGIATAATPAAYDRVRPVCPEGLCAAFERPTPTTVGLLGDVGASPTGYAVGMVVVQVAMVVAFAGLAVLLMRTRPSLLVAATGIGLLTLALVPFVDALGDSGGAWRPLLVGFAAISQLSLFIVLATFPDRRWHPRILRTLAVPVMVLMTVPSGLDAAGVAVPATVEALAVVPFVFLVGAQVHRYLRRSDWVARQQTKWVLTGLVILAANLVLAIALDIAGREAQWQLLLVAAAYLSFTLMGAGVTLALLRYRLYDVGLVLWRTFAYSCAVVALLAAYFVLVAIAGTSVARSSVSVLALATAAAAVVGGAWLVGRAKDAVKRRLFGTGGVSAALASSMSGGPEGFAETIARSLALPHVEVLDVDQVTVSRYGDPPQTGVVREPVVDVSGNRVGELVLGPAYGDQLDRRDKRALAEVLPFVVLVLRARRENDRLREARTAAASSREDERRRLRRDLHDGVGPLLASQLLTLDTLKLTPHDELLDELEGQTRAAIGEIRAITRELRPPALDTQGLAGAIAAEAERLMPTTTVQIALGDVELPAAVEVNVLRIVQEALTNVVRHARAEHAAVTVQARAGQVEVEVCDDGIGRRHATTGVGTSSMRERAEELGGTLTIGSGPDGKGTCISAGIPL